MGFSKFFFIHILSSFIMFEISALSSTSENSVTSEVLNIVDKFYFQQRINCWLADIHEAEEQISADDKKIYDSDLLSVFSNANIRIHLLLCLANFIQYIRSDCPNIVIHLVDETLEALSKLLYMMKGRLGCLDGSYIEVCRPQVTTSQECIEFLDAIVVDDQKDNFFNRAYETHVQYYNLCYGNYILNQEVLLGLSDRRFLCAFPREGLYGAVEVIKVSIFLLLNLSDLYFCAEDRGDTAFLNEVRNSLFTELKTINKNYQECLKLRKELWLSQREETHLVVDNIFSGYISALLISDVDKLTEFFHQLQDLNVVLKRDFCTREDDITRLSLFLKKEGEDRASQLVSPIFNQVFGFIASLSERSMEGAWSNTYYDGVSHCTALTGQSERSCGTHNKPITTARLFNLFAASIFFRNLGFKDMVPGFSLLCFQGCFYTGCSLKYELRKDIHLCFALYTDLLAVIKFDFMLGKNLFFCVAFANKTVSFGVSYLPKVSSFDLTIGHCLQF